MDIPKPEWTITSHPAIMKSGEVHIWRFDLAKFVNVEPEMLRLLSVDERQRADRYHFEKDRKNYINRRGMLRVILGSYLGFQPEELGFTYNQYDKPELDVETKVFFNVSSSNGIGMMAITLDTKIGIDIEFVDSEFPKMDIADRYFSTDEVLAIRGLPPDLQTAVFFDCWTKKEAYVKAIGDGMSYPLPHLGVSFDTPNSFSVTATSEDTKGWNIMSFIPEEYFIASIAYEGEQKSNKYFRWNGL